MKHLATDRIPSPIGEIIVAADEQRLCALVFADGMEAMQRWLQRRFGEVCLEPTTDPAGVSSCLRAYLAGDCGSIDSITVDSGGTPFEQEVWQALRQIPAGNTMSYGQLAAQLGRPAAARAVGRANGLNPISIVVPCHRLIGANGSLVKYGGGLDRKAWLLQHEGYVLS